MSDDTNNAKEEFEKKARELARQRKERHDNDKAAYIAAQQKKRQEEWADLQNKLEKKGMTTDSQGRSINREEALKQNLDYITSKAANTTSNWQEALMEECRLCYDLIKVLNLDIRKTRVRAQNAIEQELARRAQEFKDKTEKGEPVGKLEGIMAQAAGLGAMAMSPAANLLVPIKGELLFGLIKGGPSGALPALYDSVHFNEDGEITIDSLAEPSQKGKFADPNLEREVDKLQGLLDSGVPLWLEDQGFEVAKKTDTNGRPVYEASRTYQGETTKMKKEDFDQLIADKKNGFQSFLNGQYKEQTKIYKKGLKQQQPQQPSAQEDASQPSNSSNSTTPK